MELQFLCRICHKPQMYKYRRNWRRHYESHSDEKQFVCEVCGTGYKANYLLKNHMAKQHGKYESSQTQQSQQQAQLDLVVPPQQQEPSLQKFLVKEEPEDSDEPFYLNL